MQNRVVIITGASSGIGLALAKEYAKEGAKLSLAARSVDKLNELVDEFGRDGVDAIAVKTDVSIEKDCKNLIEQTTQKFGKIDVLINNAGVYREEKNILQRLCLFLVYCLDL